MNDLPSQLDYFTEWGGRSWKKLTGFAVNELKKNGRLDGAKLLDIGARHGKMAILFSLMGAEVTGIEIQGYSFNIAEAEAKRWNAANIKFITYNGDLDVFPDESFDVIFTKSVLVLISDLEKFLGQVSRKLKPDGQIVFIENGRGNLLLHALRAIKHRNWDYHQAHYFTDKEVNLIRSMFQIDTIKKTLIPPIYLFLGRKRS